MRTRRWTAWLAAMLGAVLLTGCAADDQAILGAGSAPGGDLLARYVALGNSITAGMQSAGINDSTQMRAYPVLIARQAGEPFAVPLLARPGCPGPYIAPVLLSTERVGGAAAPSCALRAESMPPAAIQNVAYPGSYTAGAIDNSVTANPPDADVYKTVLLGGRTQVEAMKDAAPTFVSVWLGNNETLAPAVAGDPALMPSPESFAASIDSVARAITAAGATGALLIAPVNALAFAPRFQPGAFFWALAQAGQSPKPVSGSCAPGTPGGASFVAIDVFSFPIDSITCAASAPGVVSRDEYAAYDATVGQYKAAVKAAAEANDWIYLDPDAAFAEALADPARIRKCQDLATAASPQQFAAAVASSCPGPSAPNFFGSFISFDATHPTASGQAFLANTLIDLINSKYELEIPML